MAVKRKGLFTKEYGGKDRSRDVVEQDTESHHFGRGKRKDYKQPGKLGRPRWA